MSKTIKRHFVILRDPGCIPEKKGPFLTDEQLTAFVREAIKVRPRETTITVARLTWNNDLWVDDGREWVAIEDAFDAPEVA